MVAVRIILLLLVLAEDANIFDVGIQETPGNCSSETTGCSLALKTENFYVLFMFCVKG